MLPHFIQPIHSYFLSCLLSTFVCPNLSAIFVSEDLNSPAMIMCSISVWSQGSGGFNEEHGCVTTLYIKIEYFRTTAADRNIQSCILLASTNYSMLVTLLKPLNSNQNRQKEVFWCFNTLHSMCTQQESTYIWRLFAHWVCLSQLKVNCFYLPLLLQFSPHLLLWFSVATESAAVSCHQRKHILKPNGTWENLWWVCCSSVGNIITENQCVPQFLMQLTSYPNSFYYVPFAPLLTDLSLVSFIYLYF